MVTGFGYKVLTSVWRIQLMSSLVSVSWRKAGSSTSCTFPPSPLPLQFPLFGSVYPVRKSYFLILFLISITRGNSSNCIYPILTKLKFQPPLTIDQIWLWLYDMPYRFYWSYLILLAWFIAIFIFRIYCWLLTLLFSCCNYLFSVSFAMGYRFIIWYGLILLLILQLS